MIQINVSPTLAKPLGRHLKPAQRQGADLVWRADLAIIGTEPCVVAHEQHTNYMLVLCGLDADDFKDFPNLFRDRLWREALAICAHAKLYDRDTLARHLSRLFEPQHYQLDPQPVEVGRSTQVIEKLEREYLQQRMLPSDPRAAFTFSAQINSRRPIRRDSGEQPSPMENLGNLCLEWMAEAVEQEQQAANPVVEVQDNIVKVDFSRNRKP